MSSRLSYTVGWICAVHTEHVAATAFLSKRHHDPEDVPPNDNNVYTCGQMGHHNVVIATLPDGEYGTAAAEGVARDMLRSFPNVRIGLMVGIGGGAPSSRHDIRLGDVVVGAAREGHGGVFQYDFGKNIQNREYQPTRFLDQAPTLLRAAVSTLRSDYESNGHQLDGIIDDILEKLPRLRKKYKRPPNEKDRLYHKDILHHSDPDKACEDYCGNDESNLVARPLRGEYEDDPAIHYGLIASGNTLMKDAVNRDRLAQDKGVLCFEMEAAGLMNHFPCLVIRGICDYADSHKNKDWQGYAAMTAAAYATDLLKRVPPNKVETERPIIDSLGEVQEAIKHIQHIQIGHERATILGWLTLVNYGPQLSDHLKRRQDGTGLWLLRSEQFKAWLEQKNQTLFCPGIPGAGKTVLASIVVEHLQSEFSHYSAASLAYIYFTYNQREQQTVAGLLSALLKQLATYQPILPNAVRDLYDGHKDKGTRPSVDELTECLLSVVKSRSRVFIVVDALDECERQSRDDFLSIIFRLRNIESISILATARPMSEIVSKFTGTLVREIRATRDDIDMYVSAQINRLSCVAHDNHQLKQDIKEAILGAFDGMFLLAHIYIRSLDEMTTPKGIKVALARLRKQNRKSSEGSTLEMLDYAYDQALERINSQKGDHGSIARRALLWITYAKRPLTTVELRYALGVEPRTSSFDADNLTKLEVIVSSCAGLVTVDKETDIIRVVHYTTQEYFRRACIKWFQRPESEITLVCATYLSYKIFKSGRRYGDEALKSRLAAHPLYDYAATYWGHHAREASAISSQLLKLLMDERRVGASWQALMAHKPWQDDLQSTTGYIKTLTGLHVASYFGVTKVVQHLLLTGVNVDVADDTGRTPLCYAAYSGHHSTVRLLLNNGASIEAPRQTDQTALYLAAKNGHDSIVELLLAKGADIQAANLKVSLLCCAVEKGHEAIIRRLLKMGVGMECCDSDGLTPLELAAKNGHEEAVLLLLEYTGAVLRTNIKQADTLLIWAASGGCITVVQRLLSAGANIEVVSDHGGTPLCQAAENGRFIVAQLLLDNGANIESRNEYCDTPLCLAAENGSEAVVRLLLDRGANIEAGNRHGDTPLCQAAEYSSDAAVRLLVDKGANIEAANDNGDTPLCLAAEYGCETVARVLIERGANIEAANRHGVTPLCQAAANGCEEAVRLLLANGANVEAVSTNSWTPIYWAIEKGHEAVVRLLLDSGANIEAVSDGGGTPLCFASFQGHEDIVQLLIYRSANAQAVDLAQATALSYAALSRTGSTVKPLIDAGANVDAKNCDGQTALYLAAYAGKLSASQLLIQSGADIGAYDKKNRTVLHAAAMCGRDSIVRLLLDHEAGLDVVDQYGRTPLWRAASAGNKAIVQLLLENGASIEAADSQGRTPLQIAAYRCHDRVERVLLAHGACDVDALGLQALFLEVDETDRHSVDSA